MPTTKKAESVKELEELLSTATVAIAADYRGLTVAELTALRRKLGESNIQFQIVKNTLAIIASRAVGKDAIESLLIGPTALTVSHGDEVTSTKALLDHVRTSRVNLVVRGGILGNKMLKPEELQTLASLPTKEVLVAQMLGTMNAPITGLVSTLNQVLASIVYVLDARVKQLESA